MYEVKPSSAVAPDGTSFNQPPYNFKEITEREFVESKFHSYSFDYVEYRQLLVDANLKPDHSFNRKMIEVKLFWFYDDTGYAIGPDRINGKIRYFSFGCNHKLGTKKYQPNMTYTCSECKAEIKHDWMKNIVEDTGWELDMMLSIPSRGIREYKRLIQFDCNMSFTSLTSISRFLAKVDCPGYTGVNVSSTYKTDENQYVFRTCYDSSD